MAPAVPVVMGAYTGEERKRLEAGLAGDVTPTCPACGAGVTVTAVERPRSVSYVRHRVLVLCPACRRSAAIDVPARGGPGGRGGPDPGGS